MQYIDCLFCCGNELLCVHALYAGLDLEVIGSRAEEIFGGRWFVHCCTYSDD